MKKSTRTQYRLKRIDLITKMISNLAKLLLLYKRDLETIPLPQLKKISQEVENLVNRKKDFPAIDKKQRCT